MDDYSREPEKYIDFTEGGMEEILGRKNALRQMIGVTGEILDLGCNAAINSQALREVAGQKVVGVDVKEVLIAAARQRDPTGEYLCYDGVHLADALGDRQLGGAFLSFTACAISEGRLPGIYETLSERICQEGRVVLIDPNPKAVRNGISYPGLQYHGKPNLKNGDHFSVTLGEKKLYHDIYRTVERHQELLHGAGFRVQRVSFPRPWGREMFKWWPAIVTPPYMVIVAKKER